MTFTTKQTAPKFQNHTTDEVQDRSALAIQWRRSGKRGGPVLQKFRGDRGGPQGQVHRVLTCHPLNVVYSHTRLSHGVWSNYHYSIYYELLESVIQLECKDGEIIVQPLCISKMNVLIHKITQGTNFL